MVLMALFWATAFSYCLHAHTLYWSSNRAVLFCPVLLTSEGTDLLEGSQASPICPCGNSSTDLQITMTHWWKDTDRGKPKYWERNPAHCHFVHHKFNTDWRWETTEEPPEGLRGLKPKTEPNILKFRSYSHSANTNGNASWTAWQLRMKALGLWNSGNR